MDEPLELLRRDLEVDGSNSIAIVDLTRRARLAGNEVELLATKADILVEQLESFWTNSLGHLMREHEHRLRLLYPHGLAAGQREEFEALTGLPPVDDAFFQIISHLRTVLPMYPSGVFIR